MVAVYDLSSTEGKRKLAARGFFMESANTSSPAECTHMHMHAHKNTYTFSSKSQGTVGLRLNSVLHEV